MLLRYSPFIERHGRWIVAASMLVLDWRVGLIVPAIGGLIYLLWNANRIDFGLASVLSLWLMGVSFLALLVLHPLGCIIYVGGWTLFGLAYGAAWRRRIWALIDEAEAPIRQPA